MAIILGQRLSSRAVSELTGLEGGYWLALLICRKVIEPQVKICKGILEKEVVVAGHQRSENDIILRNLLW